VVEDKDALMKRLGERRLEVTFARALQALPEAAARAGASLSADGLKLSYSAREGQPASSQILTGLYAAGLEISEVETRRARLEDVMMEILRGRGAGA